MIGDAVLYAASRATHSALDNVSRRVTWMAIAGVFLVAAMVLAIIAAYMARRAALRLLARDRHDRWRLRAGGSHQHVGAGDDREGRSAKAQQGRRPWRLPLPPSMHEAKQAVDYFGAMQVVGTAFLFGLGAARRLKR